MIGDEERLHRAMNATPEERQRLDAVLASIDGALADDEFPDAMRWSPEPETVDDARAPFDGETVWVGSEEQSSTYDEALDYDPAQPISPRNFPRFTVRRGGIRYPRPDEVLGRVDRIEEDERGLRVSMTLDEEGQRLLDQIVTTLAVPPSPVQTSPLDAVRRAAELYRRPPRGLVPDFVLFDDSFLVDPAHREEVRARREEEARRIAEHLGQVWTGIVEAIGRTFDQLAPTIEAIGKAVASIGQSGSPPPVTLRDTDPRVYALRLRQSRGTGPDRQLQRQHRPRRVR